MRINSVNHLFETDKDNYGGRYPDEPMTGKPGLGPDDYGYLDHIYTKDQEETYEMVSQFRDVFDAITLRNNLTRYSSAVYVFYGIPVPIISKWASCQYKN